MLPERISHAEELKLRLKYEVHKMMEDLQKISREVKRLEAFEDARFNRREVIPGHVRQFVWTRDGGRCGECGAKENLEFDHIIPVAEGGASSARNLQLLCSYAWVRIQRHNLMIRACQQDYRSLAA